ncbi:ABC transporter ATP-binding protein [Anopheles sinensis]|uniref:ABC transporter ATP-binding protein n=1 Tax=Anopheles sinensis TaxID=74873 RepID=A0A084VKU2_ANOSI|nr:ABC transporter ATP-binding protein [Anopheles sinensis]
MLPQVATSMRQRARLNVLQVHLAKSKIAQATEGGKNPAEFRTEQLVSFVSRVVLDDAPLEDPVTATAAPHGEELCVLQEKLALLEVKQRIATLEAPAWKSSWEDSAATMKKTLKNSLPALKGPLCCIVPDKMPNASVRFAYLLEPPHWSFYPPMWLLMLI